LLDLVESPVSSLLDDPDEEECAQPAGPGKHQPALDTLPPDHQTDTFMRSVLLSVSDLDPKAVLKYREKRSHTTKKKLDSINSN
jgi:hypothetical protein